MNVSDTVTVTVWPGVGEDEARAIAVMVARMYARWAERCGYLQHMAVAARPEGVESYTVTVEGAGVIGRLDNERGVHAITRQAADRPDVARVTGFALVTVDPCAASAPAVSDPGVVRSYVLYPYTRARDLRTGVETDDVAAVLDGDIDRFL